jgi:hypothetical protein
MDVMFGIRKFKKSWMKIEGGREMIHIIIFLMGVLIGWVIGNVIDMIKHDLNATTNRKEGRKR